MPATEQQSTQTALGGPCHAQPACARRACKLLDAAPEKHAAGVGGAQVPHPLRHVTPGKRQAAQPRGVSSHARWHGWIPNVAGSVTAGEPRAPSPPCKGCTICTGATGPSHAACPPSVCGLQRRIAQVYGWQPTAPPPPPPHHVVSGTNERMRSGRRPSLAAGTYTPSRSSHAASSPSRKAILQAGKGRAGRLGGACVMAARVCPACNSVDLLAAGTRCAAAAAACAELCAKEGQGRARTCPGRGPW